VYPYFGEEKVKENRYGWFQRGRTPMFVTRGVGESILPVRLGEPPEVVLLEGK
jgi:predicted MPP superfamily phosphohydrolase